MRTLTHSHDADGLRTGLVYPGGKVLAAGYTARGQLATMTFHGQPVATSTYRPNGQPIGTVYGNGAQRTLSYDAAGRLTGTGTNVGAATITGRGYALDAVGRRTGYVDETAANAVFSYDPAGQVLGGTVPVPGQPASVNTYAYDPEGNRTQSSTGIQPAPADPVTITGSTTYTANPLNQYTAITGNPNPTYDADGNLLSGLRSPLSAFTSTWNGENRMLSSTSANVAIADRRVENAYDALGRRVRKTVKFASTGAVIEDRYFIYDGWNVIEEIIAPATGPVETAEHVWGADLSGTAQGAGGVGGLLLRESSANGASYYHYDGNGNVTALTSGTGTVQAAYTYGPFGETLRAAGPLAQANPWRFSTKYQDDETGLLYYGYRFYNPTDGRWPSRDPIEERGGLNLYGMLANDAVNYGDYLGFGWWDDLWNGTRTCASCAKHFVYDGMGKGGVNQVIGIFDGIGNLVSDPRAAVNAMVGQIQDLVRDVRNGQLDTGTLRAVGLSDLAWAIDNSEGKGEIWWCKWSGRITAELVPYLAGGAVGGKLIGKIQGKLKAKAAKTAGQLEREGEALSGIVGPKVRIPSATGTAQYRVPDQLTSEFLKDAKNVGELRWTPQLTDFGEHAAQNNLRYLIDVRQNTIIGPRAQQMIDQYGVEINRLYPPR
jgi:RHS repeat-associated protein